MRNVNTDRKTKVIDGGRMTPLDHARPWADKGYFVIPVPHREKKPVLSGWPQLRLKPTDLPKYFGSAPTNIGLLLGEPYGICDVDLDCPESLKIFQNLAPDTKAIFGHDVKPMSHFLYHSDPPALSMAFVDPVNRADQERGQTLLEIRSLKADGTVGRHTVAPGSFHKESGMPIRFERGCSIEGIANVEADVLIRAAKMTAAACVLARNYPEKGRHNAELALSGILARAGWDQDLAKRFVLAVYTAVATHDHQAYSRVAQSVDDTFRRVSEGAPATGVPSLAKLIDPRAVDAALNWLGIAREAEAPVNAANWRQRLIVNSKGTIIPNVHNALVALHAREWEDVLRFDESAVRVVAKASPPWDTVRSVPFEWQDADDVYATAWMQRHGINVPKEITGQAIQTIAREHRFHPIRDYFESLVWDGFKRLNYWLLLYVGADDSAYVRAVGSRWMIGAVARTYQPGAKVDTAIVLEGPQGAFKSTALKVLSAPWFTDEIADLGSKDSSMQVHGVLIAEIAELDAMTKSEVSKIKAFMSRSSDRFRPPYGKHVIEVPRESVFAGTVNPGASKYIKDETGGRRFWPIKCGRIDIELLKRDRNQLWAEAVARYKANESWWLDTPELNQAAEEQQQERFDEDPWLPEIERYIDGRDDVSIGEILKHCLNLPVERWDKPNKNRVGASLRFLKWEDRKVGPKGNQTRRFFPPPPAR